MNRIAVTGAKGQLGGELCRLLGDLAVGLDVDSLDLTDRRSVVEKFSEIRPEIIINCAAYTQVDKAETEPEFARAVNVGAVENLVEACRRLDCTLVQISTDYVFEGGRRKAGDGNTQPWTEEDEPEPKGVYATTKWEGEQAAARWEKHIIVRTCGLYARRSDENAKHFVKTILRLAESRPELRVVNDQHCTPSYVPHVARAVLFLAMAKKPTGIFHVTNRGETTWFDFASELLRLTGKNVPIVPISTAEFGAPASRPAYSVLDTSKYRSLGGPEMSDWRDGLKNYLEGS